MSNSQPKPDRKETGQILRLDDALALAAKLHGELQQTLEQSAIAAQQRELEQLVLQARQGKAAPLAQWLVEQGHAPTHEGNDGSQAAPDSHRAPIGQEDRCKEAANQEFPGQRVSPTWESILPFARNRLASLCTEVEERDSASRFSQSGNGAVEQPGQQEVSADPQRLEEIVQASERDSEEAQSWKQRLVGKRLRGAFASLVAHVALLFLLGLVTLKLPGPPAGMALQSAAISEPLETVSLLEPTEAESPVSEPAEFEPVTMSDTPDRLVDVEAESIDLGKLEPAVNPSSAASRAASAVAASAANASSNASFFGAAASGNCFCYVIDGSGSMRGGPWQAAKLELLKSLSSLKPEQRFYIIFFNRKITAITDPEASEPASHALYATAENLQHARRWLDTLQIGIGAPPTKALELAISKEPDAIYLLTDGVTKVDVPKKLRDINRITDLINGEQILVPIHVIAFYSLDGQTLLRRIAAENMGQFIYVPDPTKKK